MVAGSLPRPSARSLAPGVLAGIVHVGLVAALIAAVDYRLIDSAGRGALVASVAFLAGFVPVSLSAYARLVSPGVGFGALVVGAVYAGATGPTSEKIGELGGHTIVDRPALATQYVASVPAWLGLLLFAGAAEFALRRGYGIGDERLRHVPDLPLSRPATWGVVAGVSGLVGAGTALLADSSFAPVVFVLTAAAAAVPLAALLSRGIVAPLALFALWVPRTVHVEAFLSTDSPVHLLLLGPFAVVCAVAWLVEKLLRSRYRGWDGGRFAGRGDAA